MKPQFYYTALVLILSVFSCQANQTIGLRIDQLFSDHMVLQQKEEITIWGAYTPGQSVIVSANWGDNISTKSDNQGAWKLNLSTPSAGGPYSIKIETRDSTIVLNDILIGEVWLASGQSNMEMPLKGWPPNDLIMNSDKEIAEAEYADIRMFNVNRNFSTTPIDSVNGKWTPASDKTAGDFSATAYFFARRLHRALNVPIGIIHASWGGTPVEAWTSKDRLADMGHFTKILDEMESSEIQKTTDNWFQQWPIIQKPNTAEKWQDLYFFDLDATAEDFDDSHWINVELPGRFDHLVSDEFDGAVWFRKTVYIDEPTSDYVLTIGAIDDMDITFINGEKIGGLSGAGFWNVTREMTVPHSLLKKGNNTIAIRAIDTGGPGAFVGPMTLSNDSGNIISIDGSWKYKTIAEIHMNNFYVYNLTTDMSKRPDIVKFHPNLPTVLFNGMINPLIPYIIKGTIWYQGEANVGRDEDYKILFPLMIEDWRQRWGFDFPFYYVQIAPFIYNPNPDEQVSQKLRDAQRHSLKVDKTGMVVTLDIGNPTNIHPANKQDVGKRLAGLALANDYGKDLVSSGPLFKEVNKLGDKLIIEFDYVGSGLVASGIGLTGFEIAGQDKKYVTAEARIVDDKVTVYNPEIISPVFVRYAWRDNSDATLFNIEGLPASSFTSED